MASGVVKCFVACALVACAVDQRRLGAAEPPPLGVIDGATPKGTEDDRQIAERKQFLRQIGYKF